MKFFTAATTALLFSAQALAGITSYTLSIKSDDERVNGKGITYKHEGAGINYAFVSDTSSKFAYDDESNFYTTQLVHNSNITLVLKLISYNFPSLHQNLLKLVMMVF